MTTVRDTYGSLENVAIVTLAPEKPQALEVIEQLTKANVTVSVGHSIANLTQGEVAIKHGVRLITHLFNAMLPVKSNIYSRLWRERVKFFCKRRDFPVRVESPAFLAHFVVVTKMFLLFRVLVVPSP